MTKILPSLHAHVRAIHISSETQLDYTDKPRNDVFGYSRELQ